MDGVLAIFLKLGIDGTYFHQLVIFIILFVFLKQVLFKKLLEVLEYREHKFLKLEQIANHKFIEVDKRSAEYEEILNRAIAKAQEVSQEQKNRIVQEEKEKFREVEEQVLKEMDIEKESFEQEFAAKREVALKEVDALAEELVRKVT